MKASLTAALAVLLSCGSPLHAKDIDTANLTAITNAPIIESGRLVGTITNVVVNLSEPIAVPIFHGAKRLENFTMSGEMVGHVTIQPDSPSVTVKILRVEDDIATIIIKDTQRPILPVVQVPSSNIRELQKMPHLTDVNSTWINTEKIEASLKPELVRFEKNFEHAWPVGVPFNPNSPAGKEHIQREIQGVYTIPWHHSDIVDEYQKLQVPIATELPSGDNSSVVAVANALSYLYTKASSNPVQVSKSFLTWAHDLYPLNDEEQNTAWHPSDYIDPKKLDEGERYVAGKYGKTLTPEKIRVAVTSGNEHRIDLGRLLKAVQRFGVALEKESPSTGTWTAPTAETRSLALDRISHRPIVVRCFNAWNDINVAPKYTDISDLSDQWRIYRAHYTAFVTREVAAGRPVIVTYLKRISPGTYIKRSFVVTGSGNPQQHQSLQFLTPAGNFETYNSIGSKTATPGEVIATTGANPFTGLFNGEPWYVTLSSKNKLIWPGVTYSQTAQQQAGGSSDGVPPKFEIYSLGFE
jgi:hypothetical protein